MFKRYQRCKNILLIRLLRPISLKTQLICIRFGPDSSINFIRNGRLKSCHKRGLIFLNRMKREPETFFQNIATLGRLNNNSGSHRRASKTLETGDDQRDHKDKNCQDSSEKGRPTSHHLPGTPGGRQLTDMDKYSYGGGGDRGDRGGREADQRWGSATQQTQQVRTSRHSLRV